MAVEEDSILIINVIFFRIRKLYVCINCVIIRKTEKRDEGVRNGEREKRERESMPEHTTASQTPEEPEKKAKVENGMGRNEPGNRWVKGQLRHWFCRHSLSTAVFLQHVLQHTWQTQKCPERNQVVLERVATADRVGRTSRRKWGQQSSGCLVSGSSVVQITFRSEPWLAGKRFSRWAGDSVQPTDKKG